MRCLYTKTCPCGRQFTTSDADSVYHSKSCGAKHRAARDGMPIPHHYKVWIERLKVFQAVPKEAT